MASESLASSRLTGHGAELDIAHLLQKLGFVLQANVCLHQSGRLASASEYSDWCLRRTARQVESGQADLRDFQHAWHERYGQWPRPANLAASQLRKTAKRYLPVQEVDFILRGFQQPNSEHPAHAYAQAQSGFITTQGHAVCVGDLLVMLEGRFLVEVTQKSWYSGPKHFKTRKVTELHNLAAKRGHGEQVLLLFNGGEPGAPPLETGFEMPNFKVLYFSERTIGKVPESLEVASREAEVEVARREAEVAREVARREALQRELNELKATRTPLPFASVWAVLVVVAGVALASLYVGAANQLQS